MAGTVHEDRSDADFPCSTRNDSTLDEVEIGVGEPVLVGAGINSTILFVPITTVSYTVVSVNVSVVDVCVTGTACSGSTRAKIKYTTTKAIVLTLETRSRGKVIE